MKYLKLYEEFDGKNIKDHLKERGVDTSKTRAIVDEKTEDVYFYLYNLSGQIVGYQKYNPNYPKKGQESDKDPTKYYNYISDEGYEKKIAVWGLESFNIMKDKYIFITEGIFDAARIQEAGYPAISVLCNNPTNSIKSWLKTIPQIKIVIYDNDKPGRKLKSVGDFSYTVKNKKDINELNPEEAKKFIEKCLIKSKLKN